MGGDDARENLAREHNYLAEHQLRRDRAVWVEFDGNDEEVFLFDGASAEPTARVLPADEAPLDEETIDLLLSTLGTENCGHCVWFWAA